MFPPLLKSVTGFALPGAMVLMACLSGCGARRPEPVEAWVVAGPARAAEGASRFERTRVIGFSQVGAEEGGWFVEDGAFESIAGDDHWELLWHPGGGVEQWADAKYDGWSAPLVSACPGDAPPDRVVYVVGGSGSQDANVLAGQIADAVATIRAKVPSAREIVLMPLVGGPGGAPCTFDGREVRASVAHPLIEAAIRILVGPMSPAPARAGFTGEGMSPPARLVAGPSPRLDNCGGYRDGIGHLEDRAARRMGRFIAGEFVRLDAARAASAAPLIAVPDSSAPADAPRN